MKHKLPAKICIALTSLLALLLLITAGLASARIAGYKLSWWTVDNGGGVSSSSSYILKGTIGQPDAGVLSGSSFRIKGGFWGLALSNLIVYLPLHLKNYYVLPCVPANNYCEPNNNPPSAFGPLLSGVSYYAYPNADPNGDHDYYYIYLTSPATVSVLVTDYHADGQLQFRNEAGLILGYDTTSEDQVLTIVPVYIENPGKYYIYIFSRIQLENELYTLRVTY